MGGGGISVVRCHLQVFHLTGLAVDPEQLVRFVNIQTAGADDRGLAHLAADDGGVRRHAAGGSENALRDEHAVDVVGDGLSPDENDRLALLTPLHGVVG